MPDTGVGIPASDLPKVFERFHRVRNVRARTHEGTGIGLALVQELVRLHGGEVQVQSEEGRGSTFTVSIKSGKDHLPADRVSAVRHLESTSIGAEHFLEEALRWLPETDEPSSDGEREQNETSRDAVTDDGPRNPARVLIADDNADMRDYLRRLLAHDYQVEAVGDGYSALERIRAAPPDLVLADVMMPRLGWIRVCSRPYGQMNVLGLFRSSCFRLELGKNRESRDFPLALMII